MITASTRRKIEESGNEREPNEAEENSVNMVLHVTNTSGLRGKRPRTHVKISKGVLGDAALFRCDGLFCQNLGDGLRDIGP